MIDCRQSFFGAFFLPLNMTAPRFVAGPRHRRRRLLQLLEPSQDYGSNSTAGIAEHSRFSRMTPKLLAWSTKQHEVFVEMKLARLNYLFEIPFSILNKVVVCVVKGVNVSREY